MISNLPLLDICGREERNCRRAKTINSLKQAMTTSRGMADKRLSNVYNFQNYTLS